MPIIQFLFTSSKHALKHFSVATKQENTKNTRLILFVELSDQWATATAIFVESLQVTPVISKL